VSQLVQVGVLGTSYWIADFHLPPSGSALVCGRSVRAICGRDRRRAQALAEQHDAPEVYTDYRAMIDSSELDALVVVMPEDLHHPMVIAGVEAGLHVLCEKPMAFTADRSGEMLAAAERARVKHTVQFTNRGCRITAGSSICSRTATSVCRTTPTSRGRRLVSGTAAEFVLLVG
jgi:predicted dehydrogenase